MLITFSKLLVILAIRYCVFQH